MTGKIDLIMGLQYGDEGKGKIVSNLAHNNPFGYKYHIVAKYNGGSNAGHSVSRDGKNYAFHLIPSGILEEDVVSLIGNGVVICPQEFLKEKQELVDRGVYITGENLLLSEDATVTMPHHKILDQLEDLVMNRGTTGKGIGPTYKDKISRNALKIKNLYYEKSIEEYFNNNLGIINENIIHYMNMKLDEENDKKRTKIFKGEIFSKYWAAGKTVKGLDAKLMIEELITSGELIKSHVKNTAEFLYHSLDKGLNVLAEGSQAAGLDIEGGSYPFVTSSNCGVAGAIAGLRINPNLINNKIGVVKLVPSRVGEGPFVTALGQFSEIKTEKRLTNDENKNLDAKLNELRQKINYNHASDLEIGQYFRNTPPGEFGTTTGRPRATGWLDLHMIKRTAWENGINMLALTKIDSYVGLDKFKVCLNYNKHNEPIYVEMQGYSSVHNARKIEHLPHGARELVELVEKNVGVKPKFISVGPKDEDIIVLR